MPFEDNHYNLALILLCNIPTAYIIGKLGDKFFRFLEARNNR